MTTPRWRAVIVDDEPLARKRIATLLRTHPEIEVVAEAGSGTRAVGVIAAEKPDLVFLDVQMPGSDGFGVLRALAPPLPLVIFVTAHDEHAIRAFDVQAVDYVLKPVVEDRFHEAVRRAMGRLRASSADALSQQMTSLLERLAPASQDDRLAIKTGDRILFVRFDDIDWVGVDGDYAQVHVGKETHLVRETLGEIERRLPASKFVRVHRSSIVQTSRIKTIQPWFKGDYVLTLHDGTRVTSGRTYRERVQALIR
jgi:two-component system LytT family response regulator